jgi:hypothetical protein
MSTDYCTVLMILMKIQFIPLVPIALYDPDLPFPTLCALSSPGFGRMVHELAHPVAKKGYSAIDVTPAWCSASLALG